MFYSSNPGEKVIIKELFIADTSLAGCETWNNAIVLLPNIVIQGIKGVGIH